MPANRVRQAMVILWTGLTFTLAFYAISQFQTGNYQILGVLGMALTTVLLIAGVEIQYIEYGSFRIQLAPEDND